MIKVDYMGLYRYDNPKSRALDYWTYYGSSGTVYRATCVFCKQQISSCSAKWPKTKKFFQQIWEHKFNCVPILNYHLRAYNLEKIFHGCS